MRDDPGTAGAVEAVRATLEWMQSFVARGHPLLKRNDAVCPFVAYALEQKEIHVFLSELEQPTEEQICALIRAQARIFFRLDDPDRNKRSLASLLIMFPAWSEPSYDGLKIARERVKPDLLDAGLTLGEFYPGNPDRSIQSRDLVIASSPHPMLVLRNLAPHDVLFLRKQPDLLERYRKKFPRK